MGKVFRGGLTGLELPVMIYKVKQVAPVSKKKEIDGHYIVRYLLK